MVFLPEFPPPTLINKQQKKGEQEDVAHNDVEEAFTI